MTVERFVESIAVALDRAGGRSIRRGENSVKSGCGWRNWSAGRRRELASALASREIYSDHDLAHHIFAPGDWLRFSREPFPSTGALFQHEKALEEWIGHNLGVAPLKYLQQIRRQYRLPSGKVIDILCEERRAGHRGLVVIEVKLKRATGAVGQVLDYLDELRKAPPSGYEGANVRGIIISNVEDRREIRALRASEDIEWYVLKLELTRSKA